MALYSTCKRMIRRSQTASMAKKLDIFYAANKLTDERYAELTEMLAEKPAPDPVKGRDTYGNQTRYSLKKGRQNLSGPCFPGKGIACRASDTILIDDELVVLLQCIREHFGAKVYITSGYRTAAYNATLPGASKEQPAHSGPGCGLSRLEGVPVATVAAYAESCCQARWHRPLREGRGAPGTRKTGWSARGHPARTRAGGRCKGE